MGQNIDLIWTTIWHLLIILFTKVINP